MGPTRPIRFAAVRPASSSGTASIEQATPAHVGTGHALRIGNVVVVLDEEDRLEAGSEYRIGVLEAEKSGQVVDLGLRLPGTGRGAEDDQCVDALGLTQVSHRGKTPLVFGI